MCGISGTVISKNQRQNLSLMLDVQHHRGPDDSGYYSLDGVTLLHNRLSIIDLTEAGKQPMKNRRWALTYNGEIYNYKEFGLEGNDAAVLLQLIDIYGIKDTLSRINGMFAFALYDKQYNVLHLVTDRTAQKPLYYTIQGDTFAFASSPIALLHLKNKWNISSPALQSYWKLGSVMEDSIWDGIKKLDAATWLTYNITTNQIQEERYWTPKYIPSITTQDIEDLVIDAINKVKVADVPVHIFLSGGVDSTTVASQFIGGDAIHMLSPELVWAQIAAKRFDIKLNVVSPRDVDATQAMNDYSLKCGEPSMAGLIPYITSKEASKFCKVAISANGADELFFGYDRTSENVTKIQMDHIFRSVIDYPVYIPEIDDRLSRGRWLELMTYIQFDLNKTLDFASMAHSLEVRSPFLDHRLIEAALSLPKEQHGRKEILKNMLTRMGFTGDFINRPKLGFSLYVKPIDYDQLQYEAYQWCIKEGWLKMTATPNKRDEMYLRASAFGFKQFYETWKHKIA